eukprot:SAG25_NODE_486_length_7469_cov_4.137449_3_plen_135_part_00
MSEPYSALTLTLPAWTLDSAAADMGDDPALGPAQQNYNKKHKIIGSLLNGSRGPMLRQATAIDWAGDPLPLSPAGLGREGDGQDEVALRWVAAHGESTFEGMLAHFEEYRLRVIITTIRPLVWLRFAYVLRHRY